MVKSALYHCQTVIVIDDASTDGTTDCIRDLPITLLHNATNLGKGASVSRGFATACAQNATAVITLDADGQHDANDIPKFIALNQQNPNHIIIGARLKQRHQAPKIRRLCNKIADFFISFITKQKLLDTQSGFRLYPTSLIQLHCQSSITDARFVWESEILIKAARCGFNCCHIAIASCYPSNRRQSHYRPVYDTLSIAVMIMRYLLQKS